MSYLMTITAQHFTYPNDGSDPEVSYRVVFTDREFDSIEGMAEDIEDYLGLCELDCNTLDSNSWLQSVDPETDYGTGEDVYWQAFPVLTVSQWEQLLAILAARDLIGWTPPTPSNVIQLRKRA
jgi:hypothetical protein